MTVHLTLRIENTLNLLYGLLLHVMSLPQSLQDLLLFLFEFACFYVLGSNLDDLIADDVLFDLPHILTFIIDQLLTFLFDFLLVILQSDGSLLHFT